MNMTGRQKRRLALAACVVCGVSAAAGLTATAFQQHMMFFYTPAQVASGEADVSRPFRIGGLVAEGTVQRLDGLEMQFVINGGGLSRGVTVSYSGVLPDLFREGQGVVARGVWENDILQADEILAKHDENYAPPGMADALPTPTPYQY